MCLQVSEYCKIANSPAVGLDKPRRCDHRDDDEVEAEPSAITMRHREALEVISHVGDMATSPRQSPPLATLTVKERY